MPFFFVDYYVPLKWGICIKKFRARRSEPNESEIKQSEVKLKSLQRIGYESRGKRKPEQYQK